jgi:hypothetical protein
MIADRLLHALARILLRVKTPQRAHELMMRVGSLLPERVSPEAVRAAAGELKRGTCLSRALTLAARTPASEVVIAVDLRSHTGFMAHAWLEIDGVPLDADDPSGREIARLGGRATQPGA